MTTQATAIVLAAGEGTRMRSSLPKVAHDILGVPIIRYVVGAAQAAGVPRVVVVTGHKAEAVEPLVAGVEFVRQAVQRGTGHAVMCAADALGGFDGPVVVLAGDVPLIRPETVRRLIDAQAATGAACVLLSAEYPDPTGYGRVVRDDSGMVTGIVEHKDLPDDLRGASECNAGTYCFDGVALASHLHRLEANNAQGEIYLTDLVGLLAAEGLGVEVIRADDVHETLGVNSRVQLADAAKVLQRRINTEHMLAGVTMTDPDLVWIAPGVRIGRDVVLAPMTFLMGDATIGDRCSIGPDSRVTDSVMGAACTIDSSILQGCILGAGVSVGPRAFLRPGTIMGDGSQAGVSVEIDDSRIGAGSKVPRLSYVGGVEIGSGVTVGAGTITCDDDGHGTAGLGAGEGDDE